jgi:hypothetical protein
VRRIVTSLYTLGLAGSESAEPIGLHGGAISVSNGTGGASPRPGHCVFAEQGRPRSAEFPNPDVPFGAPESQKPGEDDFGQPAKWAPQPGPTNADPRDDDVLRVSDLPTGPARRSRSAGRCSSRSPRCTRDTGEESP